MDIWVIYRIFRNIDTHNVESLQLLECCRDDAEARKYTRLFDLQVPADLKDKINHKYYATQVLET